MADQTVQTVTVAALDRWAAEIVGRLERFQQVLRESGMPRRLRGPAGFRLRWAAKQITRAAQDLGPEIRRQRQRLQREQEKGGTR